MPFRIKNWKLSILALIFIGLFVSLGLWQVSRAQQKKLLLTSFHERTLKEPADDLPLNSEKDLRFYRVKLTGHFDNQHTLLLDNKIFHGRVGYEVYTPFKAEGIDRPILIDRGFIPTDGVRDKLPGINFIIGNVTIVGMLNEPPKYVVLKKANETAAYAWPQLVEYINLKEIATRLNDQLLPYVINLDAHDPAAYAIEWQIVTMGPEKHQGYAVQWFALAFTLLILFVVLNLDRSSKNNIKLS